MPIEDEGWGLITRFRVPGYGELGICEPRHRVAAAVFGSGQDTPRDLPGSARARR